MLIEQALNDGVDIISISSNYASKDSESLKWAVARAAVDGVPIVGSMGNDGERNRTDRVGAWGSVVGVGALETDGRYADYSNYGDGVSIAAVGEMIARQASTNKIVTTAGTSNSAPLVAGVLALAWSDFDDGVTGYQILQALVATASGSSGKWNDRTGYGEVDPVALLASDPSRYPDENPFEEKQGDSVVTPDDIDDYNDGLVNPSSVYNDDTYVYRGLDEQVVNSPEEVKQTLRAQLEAAEKRAQNARELVEILKTAKTRGVDAQGDVEVEIDADGRLVNLSIDDDALQGSARELEDSIMEAYADAGRNMRDYVRMQTTQRFGEDGGSLGGYLETISSNLGSLGSGQR